MILHEHVHFAGKTAFLILGLKVLASLSKQTAMEKGPLCNSHNHHQLVYVVVTE